MDVFEREREGMEWEGDNDVEVYISLREADPRINSS